VLLEGVEGVEQELLLLHRPRQQLLLLMVVDSFEDVVEFV